MTTSPIVRPFIVAVNIFAWSSEQGFVGVAAYIACWVFMLPVMALICVVVGTLGWFIEKQAKREEFVFPNSPINEFERRRWEKEDRQYEEARTKILAQSLNE